MKKLLFLGLFMHLATLTSIDFFGGEFTSYSFDEITKSKQAYTTTYLVIPVTVDITNEEEFRVSAVNSENERISPLPENGDPDDKKNILLKSHVNPSTPEGYKVVEVKVPVNSGEDVKISAGYFHSKETQDENGNLVTVKNYVFLMEEGSTLSEENKKIAAGDPLALMDPDNYTDFSTFTGVEVPNSSRYFMVPVRDDSVPKNYTADMDFRASVDFKIDKDGNIIPQNDFKVSISVLGAEYYTSSKRFTKINTSFSVVGPDGSSLFQEDFKRGSSFNISYSDWADHESSSHFPLVISPDINFPSESVIRVRSRTNDVLTTWRWKDSREVQSGEPSDSDYFKVYRDEEFLDVKTGAVGQEDFDVFLVGLIDENKQVHIGPNDSIVLFDYDGVHNKYYDLQDTVVLVRLLPVGEEGVVNHLTVINDKLTKVSGDLELDATTSSNENRKRESDIKFDVQKTNTNEIKFNIENIDE